MNYSLQSSYFNINSTTGSIYASQYITWQANVSLYTLVVTAMDIGTPSLSSNTSVLIKVLDLNDNPPVFLPQSPSVFVVYTNAPQNQQIGSLAAYDTDEPGPNSLVTYSIIAGGPYFFIDNATGILHVNATPTFSGPYIVHNVTVLAKDRGVPPQNATKTTPIYIINVNSFVPSFSTGNYQFQLIQSSSVGTFVGQVNAISPPIPVNKTIVYAINDTTYFSIDSATGIIRSKYDFKNSRTLEWVAFTVLSNFTDSLPNVSAIASVNVTITYLNKFSTQILEIYVTSINDSFNPGDVIGRIVAQDNDSISKLQYSLTIDYNLIAVNASNGVITINKMFDYETIASSVTCTPALGQKCLTFVCVVQDLTSGDIVIAPQNLYINSTQIRPPVFSQSLYNTSIFENSSLYSTLNFNPPITVTQVGYGPNPVLSIPTSQNISDFQIGAYNGIITVAKPLDYERRTTYRFNITATNALNKMSTATVVIDILPVNDGYPIFDSLVYNASVSESAQNGTIVAMPHATDTDAGIDGVVRYSIIAGNTLNTFRIDPIYGTVYLNGQLNWLNSPSYNVTVLAVDLGIPSLSATASVVISVLPMNHPPSLTNDTYYGHVYGAPIINNPVWEAGSTNPLKITVKDPDVQATNIIIFLGSSSLPFNVNATTGIVYISNNATYLQGTYSFPIIARDDTNLYSNTATVYITVDSFDKPTFNNLYSASLPELALPGYLVATVTADGVNKSQLQYTIANTFPSAAGTQFSINWSTGALSTVGNLPPAAAFSHYDVTVKAVNKIYPSLYDLTAVAVEITPAVSVSVHLLEGLPPHTFIVNVAKNVSFLPNLFTLIGNASLFYINESTGSLFSLVSFNYETPPTAFTFVVQARNTTASRGQNITITVYIDNSNDEPPVFIQPWFNGSVSELAPVGYSILRVYATNTYPDRPVVYSILTPGVPFAINNATGDITVGVANILDYEANPRFYVLNVSATNGYLSTCSVYISVQDANDNSPKFNLSNFGVYYVSDSLQNGSIAFSVNAYDIDSGLNALLTYSIVSFSPLICGSLFRISNVTGDMVLAQPVPQSMRGQSCNFVVQAQDHGVPPLATQAPVQAIFASINQYSPIFTNNSCCGFVLQNSPAGTSVMQLATTDADPHVIVYTAVGGNVTYFDVTKDGLVQVAQGAVLNQNTWPVFTLLVVATDYGNPALSSTPYIITIVLIDTNDLRPLFSNTTYNVSVREATLTGTQLVRVAAINRDIYPNNGILYSFAVNTEGQTDYGKFTIRNDTGDILLKGGLDVLQRQFYQLIVLAGDGRWAPTNATVNIRVLGSNANAPTFTNLPNVTSLPENARDNSFVYQVKAVDPDLGANGKLHFSILSSDISSKFRIDQTTGQIFVNGSNNFDYESGNIVWVISIAVTDEAGTNSQTLTSDPGWPAVPVADPTDKPLTSVADLTIDITDINDNAPAFVLSNTSSAYYISLPSDAFVGDEALFVYTVAAIDLDQPGTPNSEVRYTILSGGDDYFDIDNVTGVISLVDPFDNSSQQYTLVVEARDLGVPSLNSTVYVYVSVLNRSTAEHPLFTSKSYVGVVIEDTHPGVSVLAVKAIDPTNTQNGTVRYTLVTNTGGYFQINETNGAIFTTGNIIKYQLYRNFTLVVEAVDSYQKKSHAEVFIQVIDINNSPPLFSINPYFFSIPESASTAQLNIKAYDADSSRYAVTRYKLVQTGGKAGRFTINPRTGVVSISATLCGALGNQTFSVIAYDNQISSLNSSALLVILITEENKYPPIFEQPSYFSDLNALSPAGKEVFPSLVTTDADVCSGPAVFAITSGNVNGTFSINATTGRIALIRSLTTSDFSFVLTVTATDTGNQQLPALSSSATAVVLAGQLLPLSITAESPGLGVYATTRTSASQYQKDVWLVATAGKTNQSIQFSLGSNLSASVSVQTEPSNVLKLRALLITEYVHSDNPHVVIVVQGEGETYSRAPLMETEVHVSVTMLALSVNGTCTTDLNNGTCRVDVPLPQSWFAQSDITSGSVWYGLGEQNMIRLGEVKVVPPVVCQLLGHQVVVTAPQRIIYPGYTFDLNVKANAGYEVLSYLLSCSMDKRLTYVGVKYPSKYRVQAAWNDGSFSISAVNAAPNAASNPTLVFEQLLNVTLQANGLSTSVNEVNISCRVQFMENVQHSGTNTLKQVLHISSNSERSCSLNYATVLLGPTALRGMLSRAADTILINSAILNGQLISSEIVTYGFMHSGDLLYPVPGLQCYTDTDVLQLGPNCSSVYLSGTEKQGANPVTVYLTAGNVTDSISLQVWVPTKTIIRADPSWLHRLANVSNQLCQQAFETATIAVETLFAAGDLRQPAIITPIVANRITITNQTVARITSGQQGLLYAAGLQLGQTDITFGQVKTTINVVADLVSVTGVKYSLVTGLVPTMLPYASTGEHYVSGASVVLQSSLQHLDTSVYVFTEATLSNGRTSVLSAENGLSLNTTDPEVLKVSSQGGSLVVRGKGDNVGLHGVLQPACSHSAPLVLGSELVSVPLNPIVNLSVTVGTLRLAIPEHADIIGVPSQTRVQVRLIHQDGTPVVVTTDPRTEYLTTDHVFADVNSSFVFADAATNESVLLTATYPAFNLSSSVGPLVVVEITRIVLNVRPSPSYSGASWAASVTLSQYTGTLTYQSAQLRVQAWLSDGTTVDITASSQLQFKSSNLAVASVDATHSEIAIHSNGTVNITVSVLDFTDSVIIRVSSSPIKVVAILNFSIPLTDLNGTINSTFLPSLALQFSDGSQIANFLTPNGPAIPNIIRFTSSDPLVVAVNNATGLLTMLGNSRGTVTITVNALQANVSSQLVVTSDILPMLGDVDVRDILRKTLVKGSTISVPLYLNITGVSLGAVELVVYFDQSILSPYNPTPGPDFSHGLFGFDISSGSIRLGAITDGDVFGGSSLTFFAALNFSVIANGTGRLAVAILTLSRRTPYTSTIGDPTPRWASAANLTFGFQNQTAFSSPPVLCSKPPCAISNCTALGGNAPPGGDTNGDCVFDLMDALFAYNYSAQLLIGNSPTVLQEQYSYLDANWNGLIEGQDAAFLLQAHFGSNPLVTNLSVTPVDAPNSNCQLAVKLTLASWNGAPVDTATVYMGLFHPSADFDIQMRNTSFLLGARVNASVPSGAYGGWLQAAAIGNSTYTITTNVSYINESNVGLVTVITSRGYPVILTQYPTDQMVYGPLQASLDSNTIVALPGGLNPHRTFNSSITYPLCINLYAPNFTSPSTAFYVNKNISINSTVGSVNAYDKDSTRGVPSGNVLYTLVNVSVLGVIAINPVTGTIYITSLLNRHSYDRITFSVQATDQGPYVDTRKSSIQNVVVYVQDINIYPPLSDQPIYYIYEVQGNGPPQPTSKNILPFYETDNDVLSNFTTLGNASITAGDPNGTFAVNFSMLTTDRFAVNLYLRMTLDWTITPLYNLTITLVDKQNPSLTSKTYVIVTVGNNLPIITSSEKAYVFECDPVGTIVQNVTVYNPDLEHNGQPTFTINYVSTSFGAFVTGYFTLDQNGVIRTARTLDREGSYNYFVIAVIVGYANSPRTVTQPLVVRVCDCNDLPPLVPPSYFGSVPENSDIGTPVTQIVATNNNLGPNCEIIDAFNANDTVLRYELLTTGAPFAIDPASGIISVNGSLDREKNGSYVLNVSVHNLGVPPLWNYTTVYVTILDANDNTPVLDSTSYTGLVKESQPTGTNVQVSPTIRATDADSGLNAMLQFSLQGPNNQDFIINATTGTITTSKVLNRTAVRTYTLLVVVTDRGTPQLSSNSSLQITVLYINQNPPEFTAPEYTVAVSENVPVEHVVVQLSTIDRDNVNQSALYRLQSYAGSVRPPFDVNLTTGEIYTTVSLCTNQNVTYYLVVNATDYPPIDNISLSTPVNVTIKVYDDNKHAPVFSLDRYHVVVPNNTGVGEVLLEVEATDQDACSPPIHYALINNSDAAAFFIDDISGALSATKTLLSAYKDFYALTVTASGSGTPSPTTGTALVYIFVGRRSPITFSAPSGYATGLPIEQNESTFAQNYRYFFNAYVGTVNRLSVAFGPLTNQLSFFADPLPVWRLKGVVMNKMVYYSSPFIYVAVQAVDQYGTTSVTPVGVVVTASSSLGSVNATGFTGAYSSVLLTLSLPPSWFNLQTAMNISYRLTDANVVSPSDTATTVPVQNSNSCTIQPPQILAVLPLHTLYANQQASIQLTAQASSVAVHCELGAGLSFLDTPIVPASGWATVHTLFTPTSISFSASRQSSNASSTSSLQPVTELRFQAGSNIGATTVNITCSSLQGVSLSGSFIFPPVQMMSRTGCQVGTGSVFLSKDVVVGAFAFTDQTVLFNTAVLSGQQVNSYLQVAGLVLTTKPYLLEPFYITNYLQLSCTSSNINVLKVTPWCIQAYLNGNEISGAMDVTVLVNATLSAPASTRLMVTNGVFPINMSFQVWYPTLPLTVSTSDSMLNSVAGWFSQKGSVCTQSYQYGTIYVTTVFTASPLLGSTDPVHVAHLVRLASNSTAVAAITGQQVVGVGVGQANITAMQPVTNKLLGSTAVRVVASPVYVLELDAFFSTAVTVSLPRPLPYNSTVAMLASLVAPTHAGAVSQLVGVALMSDGTRSLLPTSLVTYASDDAAIDIQGNTFTALETGNDIPVTITWTGCGGSPVVVYNQAIAVTLFEPRIYINASTSILVHPSDPASFSVPNRAQVSVLLIYPKGVTLDITNDTDTEFNVSSILLNASNGLVQPTVAGRAGLVTLTVTYQNNLSVSLNFTVAYTSNARLVANPYPSYVGSSNKYVSTLSLLGYTSNYQQASLNFTLYLTTGATVDATLQAKYTSIPRDKMDVILSGGNQVARVLQPGRGSVQITASLSTAIATLPIEISAGNVYVTDITGLRLTPNTSLVGTLGSPAGRPSASVTFSDGTTLPEAFTPSGQAVPGLLTLIASSATNAFTVDQSSGNLTVLANSVSSVRLRVIADDPLGLFTSLDVCTNLLPGQREVDLGYPSGCPVPPLQKGQQFTVPVRVRLDNSVGAIEVVVFYDTSLVQLTSVSAGSDWPGLTASTGRKFTSYALIGGLVTQSTSGEFNLSILQFTVVGSNGVANFNAEVLTLLDAQGARLPLPLSSPAASVAAPVGNGLGYVITLPLPLNLPSSSSGRCLGPLPCSCSGGAEVGDLDGDCILDLADVVYMYNRGIAGQCLPSSDFTNDGLCNKDDLVFLLKATYWVHYFVRNVSVTPVNTKNSSCFMTIRASVIGRANQFPSASFFYLGFGVFGSDPRVKTGYDLTTVYSHSARKTSLSGSQLPPTVNGGFFESSQSYQSLYEVTLISGMSGQNLGVVFYQAQKDAYGSLLYGSDYVGCGSSAIPLQFPEALNASISSSAGPVSFLKPNGFSPVLVFNQTLTTYTCNSNGTLIVTNISVQLLENVTIGTIVVNNITIPNINQSLSSLEFFFYQPTNQTLQAFSISPSSGRIQVIGRLDRETVPVYHIGVGVRDVGASHIPTAYLEVEVTLLDVNDNTPVFGAVVYNFYVPENVTIGYSVGFVSATDRDLGLNALVTYTLLYSANFSVNNSTGEIRTTSAFDYESVTVYYFVVVATDHGVPPLSTSTNVTVNIIPINDNSPQCRDSLLWGGVDEGATTGSYVLTVVATDADKGSAVDSTIYYMFSTASTAFLVNSLSGEVSTNNTNTVFDRSVSSTFNLTVIASNADRSRYCTVQVMIFVREPPRFDLYASANGYLLIDARTFTAADGYTYFTRQLALIGDRFALDGFVNDQSSSTTYERSLAPGLLDVVLQQGEVWYDSRLLSAIVQLRDSTTFSTAISDTPVSLFLSRSGGSTSSGLVSVCRGLDGICTLTAEVPESWFGAQDSDITVVLDVGGNRALHTPRVVTLKARPTMPTVSWGDVVVNLPIRTVYSDETFDISVNVGMGVVAFDLVLALPNSVTVGTLTSNLPWSCGSNGSRHGNYSVVCLRTETIFVPTTSDREAVFDLHVALGTVDTQSALPVGGKVVSIFAYDGPVSSRPTPAVFFGRDSSRAFVHVAPVAIVGLLAATNRSELVNFAPLWDFSEVVAMRVYAVYNSPPLNYAAIAANCSSSGQAVSVDSNCRNVRLSSSNNGSGNPAVVNVSFGSSRFLLPLRVWYPTNTRLFVSDTELNSIAGASCFGYQETFYRVYTTLVAGNSSVEVDVSDKIPSGNVLISSSHPSVVSVEGRVLVGRTPGTAEIRLANGTAPPVSVTVTPLPTSVYSLVPTVFSSLDVTVAPASNSPSSLLVASAALAPFSGGVDGTGHVAAYVQFTDGTRHYVPADHLLLHTTDPLVVSSDNTSTFYSQEKSGSSYVNVSWYPTGCGPVATAALVVNVTAPTPDRLVVTADQTVLLRSHGLVVPGLSNLTELQVVLYFKDGTSRDVTSNPSTSYYPSYTGALERHGPANVFQTNPNVDVTNMTITVVHISASGVSLNASVPLKLLGIQSITASLVHYASSSDSLTSNNSPSSQVSSLLCLLNCSSSSGAFFQQARLSAIATLSNASTVPLSLAAAGVSYSINVVSVDNSFSESNGIITLHSNARGSLLAEVRTPDSSLRSAQINVPIAMTPPSVTRVTLTVRDVSLLQKKLVVGLLFSDNSSIDDVYAYNPALSTAHLNLSVSPSKAASLNVATGYITVTDNHYTLTSVTALWAGGVTSVSFPTNLPAGLGQLDLGSLVGLPQPPVAVGDTFTVDVHANVGNHSLGAIEVGVVYGNLVELISADTTLPGYCSLSRYSQATTVMVVHFACLLLDSTVKGEPLVAQLTFRALTPGVNRIDAMLYVCDDSGEFPTRIGDTPTTSPTGYLNVLVGSDSDTIGEVVWSPVGHNTTGLGDANGNGLLDVRDAAYVARYLLDNVQTDSLRLPEALDKMDANRNGVVDVGDAVYVVRVASKLLPLVTNYSVTTVSYRDCLLVIKASTKLGPGDDSTYLYALLTHPSLGGAVTPPYAVPQWAGNGSVLYKANVTAQGEYTVELYTQLDVGEPNVGLSLLLRTTDSDRSYSPLDRYVAMVTAPGVVGGQYLAPVANISLGPPFNPGMSVRAGEWAGFSPLVVFNNSFSSDVCQSNYSITVNKSFVGVVPANHPFPPSGPLEASAAELGLSITADGKLNVSKALSPGFYVFTVGPRYLFLTVLDVNVNAPQFNQTNPILTLDEDTPPGALVGHLVATDGDKGSNALVTYAIQDDPSGSFAINATTGQLFLVQRLVRGVDYAFRVVAKDNPTPPTQSLSSNVMVTIVVLERQSVGFNTGGVGLLVGVPQHTMGQNTYSQGVDYLAGEDSRGTVQAQATLNGLLPPYGGTVVVQPRPRPARVVSAQLLQERVHHSERTVTVFVRVLDGDQRAADPSVVRVNVVPPASYYGPTVVSDFCTTTGDDLGYCTVTIGLPDAWFARSVLPSGGAGSTRSGTVPTSDSVSVKAVLLTNGVQGQETLVGSIPIEAAPYAVAGFLGSDIAQLVGLSHSVSPGEVFSVGVWVGPWLTLDYDSVTFNASLPQGANWMYRWDTTSWTCGKLLWESCGGVTCAPHSLPSSHILTSFLPSSHILTPYPPHLLTLHTPSLLTLLTHPHPYPPVVAQGMLVTCVKKTLSLVPLKLVDIVITQQPLVTAETSDSILGTVTFSPGKQSTSLKVCCVGVDMSHTTQL